MVRLPSKAQLEGKADVTLGPALNKLQSSLTKPMMDPLDPNIKLNNDYPWMARAGIRYILRDGDQEVGDIEVDFIYERWSGASERSIEIEGKSLGKPIKPTVMDWALKDTYGLRIGGAYRVRLSPSLDLIFRAGTFYETATTEVSDTSLSVLGPRRLGVTGGLGLRWGRFRLDTAYAHLFFPDREVNRSTVRVQDFGGDEGPVVGNGLYSASMDMFSMQLSVAFGRGAHPQRPRGRVPRLPHDPGYDRNRDGVFTSNDNGSRTRRYNGGVKRFSGGVKRFSGGVKRFDGAADGPADSGRPARIYDPSALVFEAEDVNLTEQQPAPAAREAAPTRERKVRTRRRSRSRYRSRRRRRKSRRTRRRSRRSVRRASTRRRTSGRRSVCLERDDEGVCTRARLVKSVVDI